MALAARCSIMRLPALIAIRTIRWSCCLTSVFALCPVQRHPCSCRSASASFFRSNSSTWRFRERRPGPRVVRRSREWVLRVRSMTSMNARRVPGARGVVRSFRLSCRRSETAVVVSTTILGPVHKKRETTARANRHDGRSRSVHGCSSLSDVPSAHWRRPLHDWIDGVDFSRDCLGGNNVRSPRRRPHRRHDQALEDVGRRRARVSLTGMDDARHLDMATTSQEHRPPDDTLRSPEPEI